MPWDRGNTSKRKAELPPGWPAIRRRILTRDGHQCTWTRVDTGQRCTETATDVDHIGDPHDHADSNLRGLCGYHHRRRTSQQGAKARQRPTTTTDRHPGILP